MLSQYIPKAGTTPFRNGFRSFLLALQFGLTLGGGGEDSANCAFTVEKFMVLEDEDGEVTIHDVEGMDVVFSIVEFSVFDKERKRFTETTYYVDFLEDRKEATAEELYKAGCDPITAQYLATGELPG